jgi:1-phosphatidylinositol-3-phosphate 5-kinase
MNDDEMLSHEVLGETEEPEDEFSVDESYAPISARREAFLDNASTDSIQQDHLKPPTPIQRHRSSAKQTTLEERLRSTKRRSIQNIQRRSRSKSRSHRGSISIQGDILRSNDHGPSSPVSSYAQSIPPSSPVQIIGELNQSSINHLQKLLTQMLVEEEVEKVDTWERALMPILLKISDSLDPDVRGMGDDIDVRSYVKIKRLPGATEADSTYISGVVFTKNLALKRMPRTISNPRIMLVTFPVEYHHSEMQLMSLDPMIAQGKEYIHNLVMRIVSHKPSVLVIGNTVSGIALDYLLQYGVATLYNVKASVIEALSRCCEADIISSIDKLSSNPELGSCGQFSVRTSVHDLIPGQKKTLVYLQGCPEELGCTVVLRGADMRTLSKIKRILDFMIYVAYNLRLETSLMVDNMINVPSNTDGPETYDTSDEEPQDSDSTVYDNIFREFQKVILSASPSVKFPPPQLLTKAREAEILANKLRHEHERAQAEERELAAKREVAKETEGSSEPADPEKVAQISDEQLVVPYESSQESYQRRVNNLLHEYKHNRAIQELALRHKQWENFKIQSPELMNPLAHQNIIVLFSNLQNHTSVPCQGPDIHVIDFYSESDCTLGQYVEDLFLHKDLPCGGIGCDKKQWEHTRNYVHNKGRMSVILESCPCPMPGMQHTILMWSYCQVCSQTMPVAQMSENSYRYSFGKFIELSFYAKGLIHRGGSCPHDIQRHHVRYFGYDNWAIRFQYDPADVLSLVVPEMRLTWEPEVDVRLKSEERSAIAFKVNRFFDSVDDRWKTISMENITAEKQESCKTEIAQFVTQAQSQRESALNTLEKIWHESMVLDRLPLNRVLKDLQDYVVLWDSQFAEFEKNYLPSDKDIRRLTAMQLRKMVGDAGLPFMDVLDRKSSMPTDSQGSEGKASTAEPGLAEKGKDIDTASDAGSAAQPDNAEASPTNIASEAIDVPPRSDDQEVSPSILPSSIDSRVSDISEFDAERRTGTAPKTLSVAPKIARLQMEIASPSNTPMRKMMSKPNQQGLTPTSSPPQTRSRNLSAQSSESDDGPSPTEPRKDIRSVPRPHIASSKIPKPKPPQPFTSIHPKTKSIDITTESRHKSRNPSEDLTDRAVRTKPHKQFMSNTIKKLQRAAGTEKSVSSLAKHFDELSRQYEKEEIKRRKRFGYRRAFPVTSAKPKVEVFSNVQDAVLEASDDEIESISVGHSRKSTMKGPEDVPSEAVRDFQASENTSLHSAESDLPKSDRPAEADATDIPASAGRVVGDVVNEMTESQSPPVVVHSEDMPSLPSEADTKESVSIMKAITSLWADRSAALWKPLEYPLYFSA